MVMLDLNGSEFKLGTLVDLRGVQPECPSGPSVHHMFAVRLEVGRYPLSVTCSPW